MKGKKTKKMKKTWLAVLGVIGLLFAGCGREQTLPEAQNPGEVTGVPEDKLLGYTYSKIYTPYQLSTCDVKAELVEPEDNELMVTKLLAGDSDYDFMVLSSESSLATDIMRTGAYYPLNEIPEVAGLLNRYHGYLKEAATAENGDIWMIPCGVDMPYIFYQEALCEERGLDFTDMDYLEFMEQVEVFPKDGEQTFSVPYYLMTGDITDKFDRIYGYDNMGEAETELLRSYMEKIRAYDVPFNEGKWWILSSEERAYYLSRESVENILFEMERTYNMVLDSSMHNIIRSGSFRAVKTPDLEQGVSGPNTAFATFIVINPKSAKLSQTIEYVSQLCEKLQTDTSLGFRWMFQGEDFSDNVLREDIYRLISDGEVEFSYPYDVVGAEVWAYREGKQDFDTMITEIQRNIKMYKEE